MTFNLSNYKSLTTESSKFKLIPIEFLEETKKILKENNIKYRIRYRGPRFFSRKDTYRNRFLKQSTCLKSEATRFSVY